MAQLTEPKMNLDRDLIKRKTTWLVMKRDQREMWPIIQYLG